jgi:hypothetical protein
MEPINPIFTNKTARSLLEEKKDIVRKKPITKKEGRKERIDKKKDVKIPFNQQERKLLKIMAKRRGLDPTPYCSLLVKKGLQEFQDFPKRPYNPKGQPYPAKLEKVYHDQLFEMKVSWDCSLKEAAYRILAFMLEEEVKLHR